MSTLSTRDYLSSGTHPGSARLLRSIRFWLAIVILGLFFSGVTAFPLQHELDDLVRASTHFHFADHAPALNDWFVRVDAALADTKAHYPFLSYGTDWLAFAHIMIAIAFIGPYLDPVRNKWVVTWGLINCVGIFFLALIVGPRRGIPFFWQLIDCSFGVVCGAILLLVRSKIRRLELRLNAPASAP
jgi:hypothetical protein